MKPQDLISFRDEDHCYVNGCLIDMVRIKHWIETTSWAPHNPKFAARFLGELLERMYNDSSNITYHNVWVVLLKMSHLSCYGWKVPDKLFSISPGLPFYRLVNYVLHDQVGLPAHARLITEKWMNRGQWIE